MKKLCNILGVIILIFGIIGAIGLAYRIGRVVDFTYSGKTYYSRDYGLTIGVFCGSFIGSLALFAILEGIGSILENQERISSKIVEIEGNINSSNEKISRIAATSATAKSNEWKCEKCGRINMNTIGTCACGQRKG